MIVTFIEHEGCFAFEMVAETMADAATLTRYATNVTDKVRSAGAYANKDGTFNGHCVLAKRRHPSTAIVRAR